MAEPAADPVVRVLVVDDHPMMRKVVVMSCDIDSGLDVVGEAGNGEEALSKAAELKPDVIVLDVGLPNLDGIEVARRLRETGDDLRILMISGQDDPKTVFEAIRAGVDGFIEKTRASADIAGSIRAVASGSKLFTEKQEDSAITRLRQIVDRARDTSATPSDFSDREKEVLNLIAEGLTNYQMGGRLGLSARTIESHIAHIYKKLTVRNRTEALAKAKKLGLLTDPSGDNPHKSAGNGTN